MRRWKLAVAATTVAVLGMTGCGGPSGPGPDGDGGDVGGTQFAGMDPDAKGPAPEVPGAVAGGTITVYSQSTPHTFDPTNIYFTDTYEIARLVFRTPTQFDIRDGNAVLVPDLTDLGTVSEDGLTWTFKLKGKFKYSDGSDVKIEDLAYAVKRSFAHELFADGPTYQLTYFKDADTYKGPYESGDNYAGVETPDAETLVIHLDRPFPDLPFYMSFPLFTPIPKEKDTRENYQNNPLATGPYMFESYTPGVELKLVRNPHWDPNTDPVRHQYPERWEFKWGGDDVVTQQQVLNSSNPVDAAALNYGNLDASLIPQLTGEKRQQLLTGISPCTIVYQMDTRKIPLEVRKAIAKAHPYDQTWTAEGLNEFVAEPASTVLPPSVQGYEKYEPHPDLDGTGPGDPEAARAMLEAAGQLGFELSWYYDNTLPVPQQITQVLVDAYRAAGFNPKPIGVTTAELRAKRADYEAPVNMLQSPAGWCSDWPTGGSWFPVLFQTHSISDGTSWGMLSDPALDKKIDDILALPAAEQTARWAELDKEIMGMYIVLPRYYAKNANVMGTRIGNAVNDVTVGMPFFPVMYVKPAA